GTARQSKLEGRPASCNPAEGASWREESSRIRNWTISLVSAHAFPEHRPDCANSSRKKPIDSPQGCLQTKCETELLYATRHATCPLPRQQTRHFGPRLRCAECRQDQYLRHLDQRHARPQRRPPRRQPSAEGASSVRGPWGAGD